MTSIEWLEMQFEESYSYINEIFKETFEQAKEMHKQEIIDAVDSNFTYSTNEYPTLGEQYYYKTFVSNESNNHISDISKMVELPQQEISDEMSKIEKAQYHAWSDYEYQEGNLYSTTFRDGWKLGCEWYREQLKQRQ
jgi:hypothetical protein